MTTDTQSRRKRYPGLCPFTQDYQALFFGRDEDIAKLTTVITLENTTVLYGRSGLGKSSLLNAGVLPKLKNEHQYFIIPVRFGSPGHENNKHALDIAEETIAKATHQESFLNNIESEDITLWQHLKALELTLPPKITLLLVFDQFEELFSCPQGVTEFAEALADLLYSRMPKDFQRTLRLAIKNNAYLLTLEQLEFLERPLKLKVVMSIRSDRMSLLDRLSSHIPNIFLNCYELKPLSRKQAEKAVICPAQHTGEFQSPSFTYQPEALNKILDYLTQKGAKSIESFQLQILCKFIEENIVIPRNATNVDKNDLGELETIYQNYYDDRLKILGTEAQRKARVFIEEGLIFEEEKRRTTLFEGQILNKFDISLSLLHSLVDTYLIRSELHSSGGYVYELSHDTLVAPILKAKSLRLESERQAKLKNKFYRALYLLLGPTVLFGIIGFVSAFIDKELATLSIGLIGALYAFAILLLLVVSPFALIYEIIFGESILTKIRGMKEQKGILAKLGRWLS